MSDGTFPTWAELRNHLLDVHRENVNMDMIEDLHPYVRRKAAEALHEVAHDSSRDYGER